MLVDILNDKGFYANRINNVHNTKMYYGGIELAGDVDGFTVTALIIPDYEYGFNYDIKNFREMFEDILNRHVCGDYFIPFVEREEGVGDVIETKPMVENDKSIKE